jgi:conjugal transfer pilus assembly protein TraW
VVTGALVATRVRVLGGVLLLASMGPGGPVHAADLGTIGPVYPIAEPDMLDEIQATLQAKQASGEIGRLQQKAFKRMRSQIETPAPVPMLVKARRARGWEVDPSVRFDEPIVDHEGRVVIPAGTLANPLAVVRLSSVLLFIDGRDRAQVDAAKRFIDRSPQPVKPILTAGSPVALSRAWQRPVYFDQAGRLVQRFGIQAVPARVSQAGQVLSVKEFPVEEFPA